MTDAATLSAKLDKAAINFDRFDAVVNGATHTTVHVDSTDVPTLAETIRNLGDQGNLQFAAIGAPWVRKSSERAGDYVRIGEYRTATGNLNKAALQGAYNDLVLKGGGKLWCDGYDTGPFKPIDIGASSFIITNNKIKIVGDGETIIQSTALSGPVLGIGDGLANPLSCGIDGIRVFSNNGSVVRTDPVVWLRNTWEAEINIAVHGGGSVSCGDCLLVDGGSNTYNTRVEGIKAYGPYTNGLVVGKNSLVVGFYLGGGFSFGFPLRTGMVFYNVDGCMVSTGEVIGAALRSLELVPGPGQRVGAFQMDQVQLDTAAEIGILMKENGGRIIAIEINNMWNATNGNTLVGGAYHEGMRIEGATPPSGWGALGYSPISGVKVNNSIISNNGGGAGIFAMNCDNVKVNNTGCDGNGVHQTSIGCFVSEGCRNFGYNAGSLRGKLDGAPTAFQAYPASVGTDTAGISFTGFVDMSGNQNNSFGSNTSANPSTNNIVLGTGYHF